ncbi:TIGR02391 family protein [Granulicella rosea]|uniref:TIGR02391 family protein n=1 Tax=Granulicella rosea TaxID=474952 RepID=A0A239GNK9_9BACT|nr:TIGR02391 family protein [Granulicella rosea]SNS70747.1 TIGR02391 family protein [Granulicella rosea]
MAVIPKLDEANLQAICDILGATDTGLTGTEIGRYLGECGCPDPIPQMTKRHRLYAALVEKQNLDRCANNILGFITHVMNPVRHVGSRDYFESERGKLNSVLAFSGLTLGDDGKLREVKTARTLSESEAIASALRKALVERNVHADVLKFCRAELVVDNYFHAVFEASKSIAEKLRVKTGLGSDGSQLVDEALGIGKAGCPRLAFNSLRTENERNEHSGLMNLIKGLFGAFRNTAAHAPKIHWNITEQDALDILTTISLVHRRLDTAVRTHIL